MTDRWWHDRRFMRTAHWIVTDLFAMWKITSTCMETLACFHWYTTGTGPVVSQNFVQVELPNKSPIRSLWIWILDSRIRFKLWAVSFWQQLKSKNRTLGNSLLNEWTKTRLDGLSSYKACRILTVYHPTKFCVMANFIDCSSLICSLTRTLTPDDNQAQHIAHLDQPLSWN